MTARILGLALVASTLLMGAGTASVSAASSPTVYWYTAQTFFCPQRYTRYGHLILCKTPLYRLHMGDDAMLFFPNILAVDSEGSIYYTETVKAYKVVGKGMKSHMVKIGEQRALQAPQPISYYRDGKRHWAWEPLSELMDPTFGVQHTDDDRPVKWTCNTDYVFYVATGRGDVNGFASLYLTC